MPLPIGIISQIGGALGGALGGDQQTSGIFGAVAGLIGSIFGDKAMHWHVYEYVSGGSSDIYITEVSEQVFETLRQLAPTAIIDSGKTFKNLKLPKNLADQFRLELTSGPGPVPFVPSQYGPQNVGDSVPVTVPVVNPVTGAVTYQVLPPQNNSSNNTILYLIGGFFLAKMLKIIK